MSEWYKFEPLAWDRGTDNLTLEQEAAFLRVCNAIYASDQPISENYRVLGGLWRCNERKSKRLLSELIDAGKLTVVDGLIHNERAVYDVSIRRELRVKRQLAGVRGGIESGKSRSKSLKNNNTTQASGSTREEKRREEYNIEDLLKLSSEESVLSFLDYRKKSKHKAMTQTAIKRLYGKLGKIKDRGGDCDDALGMAEERGWATIEPDWYFNSAGSMKTNGASSQADMYRNMK